MATAEKKNTTQTLLFSGRILFIWKQIQNIGNKNEIKLFDWQTDGIGCSSDEKRVKWPGGDDDDVK